MRKKFYRAGSTVKVKDGVGRSFGGQDMSGKDFTIEDWCENVIGCDWKVAKGPPAALEYAMRIGIFGRNNDVPKNSDDVVYGHIDADGHLFHINALEEVGL